MRYRRNRQTHQRLIVLASLSMIAPSITRIAYVPLIPIDSTAFTLLATYLFLAVPFLIDRRSRGKVHPVIKWGVPGYVVSQILFIGVIPATTWGRTAAFFL